MIELKNVYKRFDGDVHALRGINLSVNEGSVLGIIGLSGAGKSTLIRTMNLLETPSEGEVLYHGRNIAAMNRKELMEVRRKVAMIFQGFCLMNQRTVLQNVMFPLEIKREGRRSSEEKALRFLERVGLSDKKDAYPAQLSGGQKQRVAIARALAGDPEVILCDEATSALDPETTGVILDLLKGINREYGITIVLVTHEMDVVNRICDEVAIVDHGVIVEQGRTKDIFLSPQTAIAKKMVLGNPAEEIRSGGFEGDRLLRITFDETTYEPILANMILQSGLPVNIMFANTRYISGSTRGQMIIKLPKEGWEKHIRYLQEQRILFEEFDGDLERVSCENGGI